MGVFGVELSLTHTNEILATWKSRPAAQPGHRTIEACRTCQFEQHVRAVAGLPLGSTEQHSAAVMVNLLERLTRLEHRVRARARVGASSTRDEPASYVALIPLHRSGRWGI